MFHRLTTLLLMAWTAAGAGEIPVFWRAPASSNDFKVVGHGGGLGYAEWHGDGSFTVFKTNDVGVLCVSPVRSCSVRPGARLRQAIKVSAEGLAPCESFARLRFVYTNSVTLSRKLDAHSVGGGFKRELLVNTPPGRPQEKFAYLETVREFNEVRPQLYLAGRPSRTTWRDWRLTDYYPEQAAWRAANESPMPPPPVAEEAARYRSRVAADVDHTARTVKKDGFARLAIDGQIREPVLYKARSGHPDRFFGSSMTAAGVPLVVIAVNFASAAEREGEPFWTKDGFDAKSACDFTETMMRHAPEALFVLTLSLTAYPEMTDRHPEDVWVLKDGREVYGYEVAPKKGVKPPRVKGKPWISNHSRHWRAEAKAVIAAYIAEMKARGLFRRVVGVHLAGYYDGQFATGYPDYSQAAKDAFAAWKKQGGRPGVKDEYGYFLKTAQLPMLEDLARHVRASAGKDIILMRWCMSAFGGGYCSVYDVGDFLRSDVFDALVPQPSYNCREPGYPLGLRLPWSSFHEHGKLLVYEFDFRTWCGAKDFFYDEIRALGVSRARDPDEWHRLHFRAAGALAARRAGWWYFDMTGGWFEHPAILSDITAALGGVRRLYDAPDAWKPSCAYLIDEDGVLARTDWTGHDVKGGRVSHEDEMFNSEFPFAASGVPYALYLVRDAVENPALLDGMKLVFACGVDWSVPDRAPLRRRLETAGVKVLSAVGLKSRAVHEAARAAGCYVPAAYGLQVDMCGSFASIHCLVSGRYAFTAPNGRVFDLDLTVGDTRWLEF